MFTSSWKIRRRILTLALSIISVSAPLQGREILDMNSGWSFYRGDIPGGEKISVDDTPWMPVSIPHIMQLEKKHCGGNAIYDGTGWYRRYFRVPDRLRGQRIAIEFEGVMKNCTVYVNGEEITGHYGGYMGFTVDITDKVKPGDNVIAVKVSAADDPLTPPGKPQGKMDFYYYSGIYRDVRMIATDRIYITDPLQENITAGGGQFVTFPEVSNDLARVDVKTHIRNTAGRDAALRVTSELIDPAGKVVARANTKTQIGSGGDKSVEQRLEVRNPVLWHPYHPDRYTLRTVVKSGKKVCDETETKIGIRNISYSTDEGFRINGERLYLRGANRHQAFPNIGDAAPNSMQERDVIDLKRGGYNAVRAAHYPQDPAFLDACDKYGLLVVECIPGWQFFNKDSVFVSRLFDVGKQMIRRDRNHPSVILWETALNESRYPVAIADSLHRIAHAEYPGSQMYTAGDYLGSTDMAPYFDVLYKQVANYPKNGDVMSNFPEDFLSIKPLFTREWGDGAGEKPRVSISENEDEQLAQCISRIKQLNGNGYFDWCMLDANPHMAGHFVWSYNDYARGSQAETMYSGVVDINRYPKFSYYMLQSQRDKSISQTPLFEGPTVYVASHNSGPEYAASTSSVTVFSNCDAVRLYRNERLIGEQTKAERTPLYRNIVEKGGSPLYVFDTGKYEPGTLRAEGIIDGKVAASHSVTTPGKADHVEIEIKTEQIQPVADGSDLIPVYFKICDSNGTVVPDTEHELSITVTGEGKLVGDTISRLGINPQLTEGGIGFAFIRTTPSPGSIRVTADADGLRSGTAETASVKAALPVVPDGNHGRFLGREEDNVVIKESTWEKNILARPRLAISSVEATSSNGNYPKENIIDNNDKSWWIAESSELPQTVTLTLAEPTYVSASRVLFQKDSASYRHKVETSDDGKNWKLLYRRECTGWDFSPMPVNREVRFVRLTIEDVSEGIAGLGEFSLY